MRTIFGIGLLLIAAGFIYGLLNPAQSQDHDAGHTQYHPVYENWMMPHAPSVPCCYRKELNSDGEPTGDCYPTEFRPVVIGGKFDHWMARRDNGAWIDVPDSRLIRQKNPDNSGVHGHLCEVMGMVYCALPPTGSM